MKYSLYLLILITVGCSVQNGNGSSNYPKPNLTEAFQRLDRFISDIPVDEFTKTSYSKNLNTGSSIKTNEEAKTIQENLPACYVVQYHHSFQENILIINYVFYTNNTTIQSHTAIKYKLTPININKLTFKKVNDNYSELPPSFYKNFTIYGATPLYNKYEKFGEEPLISTGTYNPSATSFHEYFAIKNTSTSFSSMKFSWNIDYDTGHITLLYNGSENSIDEDLEKYGTTPNQAANIEFGTLDIPHI